MFFIQRGDWLLAAVLFILANIGANGSFVFYDALLPHIAATDEIDRVSTAGYALGYVGGGLLLALNLAGSRSRSGSACPRTRPERGAASLPARLSFVSRRVWWLRLLDPALPPRRRAAAPRADRTARAGAPPCAAFARLAPTPSASCAATARRS